MKNSLIFCFFLVCSFIGWAHEKYSTDLNIKSVKKVVNDAGQWQMEHMPIAGRADAYNPQFTGWADGVFLSALADWAAYDNSRNFIQWYESIAEKMQWEVGHRSLNPANDIAVSLSYAKIWERTKKSRYLIDRIEKWDASTVKTLAGGWGPLIPTIERLDYQMKYYPKTENINFEVAQNQERWCWCDALYMAAPTYALFANITGNDAYREFMNREFWITMETLYDREEKLISRDTRFITMKEPNGEKLFWGRGNGWVVAGMARIMSFLPLDYPSRTRYEKRFQEIMSRIVTLQDKNGYWHTSLLDTETYKSPETSATGFNTYALWWGINNGLLEKEIYLQPAIKAWQAMVMAVQPDGMLGFVQPIGDAPQNVSATKNEVYGTAALLLAGLEVARYIEKSTYPYARPARKALLDALRMKNPNFEHPRLYARSADFDSIRQRMKSDAQVKSWCEQILDKANKIINTDTVPFTYEPIYVSPPISRSVPGRLYTLSMAYQISFNQKYADRAIQEMEAIAQWPDWGIRPNFLSVADIMQAFSVGYDWCYGVMTPKQRLKIRNSIVNKGLKRMIDEYNTNPAYHFKNGIGNVFGNNNWNPWCNGAASACALVLGDEEPVLCGEVLERALVIVENFAGTYAPDGASVEGVGYGNGAMSFYIKWIAAMESALGTSYNYFNVPGIAEYVYFAPYMNGPVASFNFHDSGNDSKKYLDVTFYMANKLKNPALGNMRTRDILSGNTNADLFDILWYNPENYKNANEQLPLDKRFGGLVQTGSFRNSFTDPDATFLAFHAGENEVTHTHLDIGTFNIDAMGLNWAMDLGTDPITYDPKFKNSFKRYEIYRLNPGGHNTLLINPSKFYGQSIPAYNPIIYFNSVPAEGSAIIDMTKAYQTQANKALRGYALTDNRTKIIIQDELDLKEVSEVWWLMHTRAHIVVSTDGKSAMLTQQGKQMRAILVSPAEGNFLSLNAEPLPQTCQNVHQTPNTGIRKLAIKISGVQKTTIRVELIPLQKDADQQQRPLPLIPLNKWSEQR